MRAPLVRRRLLQRFALLLVCGWLFALGARAQGIELTQLQLVRSEGALTLDYAARINLPRTVEEALERGVPVYFLAQAELKRHRWYWRDERVAAISRSWRVAYQPLTASWRVGLGGLNQSYPSLGDALASISRSAGWKLVELSQLESGDRYYLDFSYRLDTTQLPSPMQLGLGGQTVWAIGVERQLALDNP